MTDQGFRDEIGVGAPGFGLPGAARAPQAPSVQALDQATAVASRDEVASAGPPSTLVSTGPLARRVAEALARGRGPAPLVLRSEAVTALVVDLPRAPYRQRAALLTFAVEERVGVPIDQVVVAPGPAAGSEGGTARIALVVSRGALAAAARAAPPDAPILPDFVGIPRPRPAASGPPVPTWAVWREGDRAVVRRQDGTGFAVRAEALPLLWARAGRPALLCLHEPLPGDLPAVDLSAAPPHPDAADLAHGFRLSTAEGAARARRPLLVAAIIVGVSLLLHLALAATDAAALGRVAAEERARAEAALASVLPGVDLSGDPDPILARLSPAAPTASRSGFLPLLATASEAMAASGRAAGFRRLGWSAEDGALVLLVQGAALDDLQATEAALIEAGLGVTVGAASAGEGAAEVEMRVTMGVEVGG